MSDGGKGSARRPKQIAEEQYAERWDLIFGRDQKETNNDDEATETNCSRDAIPAGSEASTS